MARSYIAIDLKSFYASVECVDRCLDPLDTNLVVADESRTDKTICLAVSPSLKQYGIPGRARLFEVRQAVKLVNAKRRYEAPGHKLTDVSCSAKEISSNPSLELGFIAAKPRMGRYMEVSAKVYSIYLKYIAPEDIHVYSVDEVFMDVTDYLAAQHKSPKELAMCIILDVLRATGITATAGIGSNMFLAKVAMDVVAKKIPADENGVRIAELDEYSFRRKLWTHQPLTDIWRIGPGTVRRLKSVGLYTLGDIARCSIGKENEYYNENLLYKLFGVNAELLIDHAWGWEPARISDIKAYQPTENSISNGQVLSEPYSFQKGRIVVREMADSLVLSMVEKGLVTDRVSLSVCFDTENLLDPARRASYHGPVERDHYGREVPKPVHGFYDFGHYTSSSEEIMEAVAHIFDAIAPKDMLFRRFYVVAERIHKEQEALLLSTSRQLSLFDLQEEEQENPEALQRRNKERVRQETVLAIRKKFGPNAIVRGLNLEEGATGMDRNRQIGGHKA